MFATYVLPLNLPNALGSKKKSFSWTQGFGGKGGRTKKGFIWAALGNTGEEFWIARMSQISGDNKQQGKAGIIHLPSYIWGLSKNEGHVVAINLPQQWITVQWITFHNPPSLNFFLPLTAAALSLKVPSGNFFGQDPLLPPSAVKARCLLHIRGWKCQCNNSVPSLLPIPPTNFHYLSLPYFVHIQISTWDFFFSLIRLSCPGLLLPLIISLLPVQHLEQAPLLSAQEGDTLLFSTDLITEVVFPRIKTNTCTNNVPTTHSSSKEPAINAFY